MLKDASIDLIWVILMLLTLVSATIAESAQTGLLVTIIIAASVAFKGRMVVDRFMELVNANCYLRNAMRIYFYVIPLMIVLAHAFPDAVASITALP